MTAPALPEDSETRIALSSALPEHLKTLLALYAKPLEATARTPPEDVARRFIPFGRRLCEVEMPADRSRTAMGAAVRVRDLYGVNSYSAGLLRTYLDERLDCRGPDDQLSFWQSCLAPNGRTRF